MHRTIDRAVLVGVAVLPEEVDIQCPQRRREAIHSRGLKDGTRMVWASVVVGRTALNTDNTIRSISNHSQEGHMAAASLKGTTIRMANMGRIVNNRLGTAEANL